MNEISRKRVITWLLCGCFFIFSMVVVGGITRLTGSGLSITEWNVVMGAIPPLNANEWNEAFEKYKQIPQFRKLNYDFTVSDFKKIFFWEYLHRLIGRLTGVVFLVPFVWFYFTRQLDRSMIRKSAFLFALGALQGFIGWFMVKSGLTGRTSVSHYRLAVHLITAFITFACTLWFSLELMERTRPPAGLRIKKIRIAAQLLLAVVLLQVIYGAFTAGLHAGKFANTFPKMDGEWIPSGIFSLRPGWLNFFENPVTVQFLHRLLAFGIVMISLFILFSVPGIKMTSPQKKSIYFLITFVGVQFLLGVLTLLSGAEITLASVHQAGAFLLFTSVIVLLFRFRSTPLRVA